VRRVENLLKERDAYGATFYEIGEHAPIAGIRNGVQVFRDSGADVIVAVGGGSPIDASKAMIHTIQKDSGGAFHSIIAIPTTLSAAEYTVSRLFFARGVTWI
jgi:alcohol dehydrogenase class IV